MPDGRSLTLKGEFAASEDVTLDFAVEGTIEMPGQVLVIAGGTHVHAAVKAKSVIVHGHLDGHISADRVELAPTALVAASIVSPRLAVQDGAQFTGAVNTERAQAAGSVARHRQKST